MSLSCRLADVPIDRVVQVRGMDAGPVARAVAEDSTGLVAVVMRASERWAAPREFVAAVLDELEQVAVELLPAWLPEAAGISRADVGGVAGIRMIAGRRAAEAHYSRSFLRDLAVLAVTGHRDGGPVLPVRARAAQLARLVGESFGRTRCVLVVPLLPELTRLQRDALVAGGDWLTQNAKVAVWLLGPSPVDAERVPLASLADAGRVPLASLVDAGRVPPSSLADAERVPPASPDDVPAEPLSKIGRPHPASAVEAALEAALAAESWAAGRLWNHTYRSTLLSAPIRLDLVWLPERCVVELDGPEHCHPVRFEADRQRDVQLQLDGYAVLRFTNARVVHDVGAVVHQIGTYLRGRRRDTAEGT